MGRGWWVKGQKIAHNDQNIFSVELHISGTIHHMILINGTQLMVHMCKRIISPGDFLAFFPNFNFRGHCGKKEQNMA